MQQFKGENLNKIHFNIFFSLLVKKKKNVNKHRESIMKVQVYKEINEKINLNESSKS